MSSVPVSVTFLNKPNKTLPALLSETCFHPSSASCRLFMVDLWRFSLSTQVVTAAAAAAWPNSLLTLTLIKAPAQIPTYYICRNFGKLLADLQHSVFTPCSPGGVQQAG